MVSGNLSLSPLDFPVENLETGSEILRSCQKGTIELMQYEEEEDRAEKTLFEKLL